jgi:hypothetical protein
MNPEQTKQHGKIGFFDVISIITLAFSPYLSLIIYSLTSDLISNLCVDVHGKPMEGIGYLFGIFPTFFIILGIIKLCIYHLKKNHSKVNNN